MSRLFNHVAVDHLISFLSRRSYLWVVKLKMRSKTFQAFHQGDWKKHSLKSCCIVLIGANTMPVLYVSAFLPNKLTDLLHKSEKTESTLMEHVGRTDIFFQTLENSIQFHSCHQPANRHYSTIQSINFQITGGKVLPMCSRGAVSTEDIKQVELLQQSNTVLCCCFGSWSLREENSAVAPTHTCHLRHFQTSTYTPTQTYAAFVSNTTQTVPQKLCGKSPLSTQRGSAVIPLSLTWGFFVLSKKTLSLLKR